MSVTILEVLENADYNLNNAVAQFQIDLAKEQLKNAIKLLNDGHSPKEEFKEEDLTND